MVSKGWSHIGDGILSPDFGENWRCVQRSYMDSRSDRPTISIPNLSVFEIPIKEFKSSEYSYYMRPFGVIDFETWRDFDNPNLLSFLFYRTIKNYGETYEELSRDYRRTGMKIKKNEDGSIPRNSNNWPKEWVRDDTKWKKGAKKPRKYGERRRGDSTHIQISTGWIWDDEVASTLPRLIKQAGVELLYAHNATVDVIALLSQLEPSLEHPLLHFLSDDPEERTRILFKGGSILTSHYDLAQYFEEPYERKKFNKRTRELETHTDYPLEIRDSLSLLSLPLGKLGEAIGYEKTETPEIFTNDKHPDFGNYMAITQDDVRYAIDDCVILWRSLLELWNLVKELGYHGREMPMTIGSLGFQMIAHSLKDTGLVKKSKGSWKYECVHNRPDLDAILRDTLVGGKVRVFDSQPYEGASCGIDARAMYPSVECEVNDVWPNWTKLKAVKWRPDVKIDQVLGYEGGVHVHWIRPESDQIGAVASRDPKTGNLVWDKYEGTRWITMLEARWLIERGYELKVVPFIYERDVEVKNENDEIETIQEATSIFSIVCPKLDLSEFGMKHPFEEVERWFDRRLEMKKAGDPREQLIKILMNAGSFGKWVEINQDVRISTLDDALYSFENWDFNSVAEFSGEMIGYVKNPVLTRAKNTANILGSYITAAARKFLIQTADNFGAENLLYCDTDSLKVKLNLDQMKERTPEGLLGRNMGQWAIENEHDYFHAIKPKQYKAHYISKEDTASGDLIPCDIWKIRIKGVNIRGVIAKLWRDEFTFGRPTDDFTLAALKRMKLSDPMVYERLIGLRESFRRGEEAGRWMNQSKQLRQSS
jgi:hypothetical protein